MVAAIKHNSQIVVIYSPKVIGIHDSTHGGGTTAVQEIVNDKNVCFYLISSADARAEKDLLKAVSQFSVLPNA